MILQSESAVYMGINMKEKKERGAVVVEAIISMTTFMFAILIILSIADIAYVQSKMAVALNSAAKEISQYCYLYYKFQLDDANATLSEGTEDAEKNVTDTVDGLGAMMDSFGEAKAAGQSGGNAIKNGDLASAENDFNGMIENIQNGATTGHQTVSNLADEIAADPKGFIIGMGKLAGRELGEGAKVYLGQIMAKAFMSKNLKAASDDDPDIFLKRLHVIDGMDGLDFQYTSLMAYGSSNEIHLVCTYQVRVIRLLNVDFAFTFRQTAKTLAWGDGASIITPRSVWTSMAPVARGKYIVGEEKQGYSYTSSGNGYDAYLKSSNQFVAITTLDPTSASYQDVNGIKNRLKKDITKLDNGVSALGDPITVTQNNEEVTLPSEPSTRSYKVVLVIPEGTDAEYVEKINQAKRELVQEYAGKKLVIEVKKGYGSIPSEEEETTDNEGETQSSES